MSFNAKNLSYGMSARPMVWLVLNSPIESKEPNFLRKLRSEVGRGISDRHERPLARPKMQKNEDEDDQPTYVDEDSHDTISKADYDTLTSRSNDHTEEHGQDLAIKRPLNQSNGNLEKDVDKSNEPRLPDTTNQGMTVIGTSYKKRLAKIVVEDDDRRETEQRKDLYSDGKKPKVKKSKKVKLSFDEAAEM